MAKKYFYDGVKIFDPHRNGVPGDIKRSLLDGMQERYDCPSNDTFHWWTVGEHQEIPEDEDDLEPGEEDLKKVDDWFLENGLEKGERLLVLYWW